jgi:methionyl-tRNA formyltransferase
VKKITLFLMTKKGYQLLAETAVQFHHLFEVIVIGRDAAVDNDYHDEIVALCDEHGIVWRDRTPDFHIQTDFAMAVSWRWLIAFPLDRLIVFHDSLLPRYRGFNPLVSCLINGDQQIGVTALLGAERYDSGSILAQSSTNIEYPCTIARAIDVIAHNYREVAVSVLEQLAHGRLLEGTPQDDTKVSYSLWRDEEDYRLPWDRPASWLVRFIDAVGTPYKGALTLVNGKPARIVTAQCLPDVRIENRQFGKVVWTDGSYPVVVCAEGLLRITGLIDDQSDESLLPLERFRTRFT